MKNTLLFLAFLFIVLASACKKDSKDPEPLQGFRLTEMVWSVEGTNDDIINFSYNDDKVSGWTSDSTSKVDVIYSGTDVVEFIVSEQDSSNRVVEMKMVYTFSDMKIQKIEGFDFDGNELILLNRTTYQYNNGNVIEELTSYFHEGNATFLSKKVYSYSGNLLDEYISYQFYEESWRESTKVDYQYENDRLKLSITSGYGNDIWNPYYKDEFNYEGGKVIDIKTYNYVEDELWTLSNSIVYNYDNDGNMINAEESSQSGNTYTISYTYEVGLGNLSLFNFDSEYGYPHSVYDPKPKSFFKSAYPDISHLNY